MKQEIKPALWSVAIVCIALLLLSGFQNAGNTGTFTGAQLAFTSQSNATSAIFKNIGQSAHFLSYCNLPFAGKVTLEQSFDGSTNWVTIAQANYVNPDNACHVLQAGGYFQNVRAKVAGSGTVTAWYSSTSGPIAFAATGIGGGGASPPIVPDASATALVGSATTLAVGTGAVNAGETYIITGMVISFNGATSAGSVSLGWALNTSCTTPLQTWHMYTTANTPQTILLPNFLQRSPLTGSQQPCFTNASGAGVSLSLSTASVRLP